MPLQPCPQLRQGLAIEPRFVHQCELPNEGQQGGAPAVADPQVTLVATEKTPEPKAG